MIETDFADVPLNAVLATGLYDAQRSQQQPRWYRELHGFADHSPKTDEYGIESQGDRLLVGQRCAVALADRARLACRSAAQVAPGFGDRRQELVFIGIGLDRGLIQHELDRCLVGAEDSFDAERFCHLPDPFPSWRPPEGMTQPLTVSAR